MIVESFTWELRPTRHEAKVIMNLNVKHLGKWRERERERERLCFLLKFLIACLGVSSLSHLWSRCNILSFVLGEMWTSANIRVSLWIHKEFFSCSAFLLRIEFFEFSTFRYNDSGIGHAPTPSLVTILGYHGVYYILYLAHLKSYAQSKECSLSKGNLVNKERNYVGCVGCN